MATISRKTRQSLTTRRTLRAFGTLFTGDSRFSNRTLERKRVPLASSTSFSPAYLWTRSAIFSVWSGYTPITLRQAIKRKTAAKEIDVQTNQHPWLSLIAFLAIQTDDSLRGKKKRLCRLVQLELSSYVP